MDIDRGNSIYVTLLQALFTADDPAADESGKKAYFEALRAADAGDLGPLTELWLGRLANVE